MNKIQIHLDPMTVIPSDWEYIEKEVEEIEDRIELAYIFDEDELSKDLPVVYVSNLGYFKADLSREPNITVRCQHLDLVKDSILAIERILNEKK